jgi:hypothetical protein
MGATTHHLEAVASLLHRQQPVGGPLCTSDATVSRRCVGWVTRSHHHQYVAGSKAHQLQTDTSPLCMPRSMASRLAFDNH